MAATVTVTESHEGRFTQAIRAGNHTLRADEPLDQKGDDLGPSPYDLLLAALGSCTAMTIRMVADRRGWPLRHVEVLLKHARTHAKDCADCETVAGMVDVIVREVVLEGDLDDIQRKALLDIADKCPVHRTLTGEIKVVTGLAGRAKPPDGGEE